MVRPRTIGKTAWFYLDIIPDTRLTARARDSAFVHRLQLGVPIWNSRVTTAAQLYATASNRLFWLIYQSNSSNSSSNQKLKFVFCPLKVHLVITILLPRPAQDSRIAIGSGEQQSCNLRFWDWEISGGRGFDPRRRYLSHWVRHDPQKWGITSCCRALVALAQWISAPESGLQPSLLYFFASHASPQDCLALTACPFMDCMQLLCRDVPGHGESIARQKYPIHPCSD